MPDFENFDPDEMFLLVACGIVSVGGFFHWFLKLRPVSKLGIPSLFRAPLYLSALLGFAVLACVIWRWADQDIRDNSGYVLLVLLMGGAWLTVAAALFPWLGTGLRDDAFGRRNFAAVLALSGAILGVMLTFSGANVGEGPSFWNNVFSGTLATGTLLLFWLVMALAGGTARSISEERDVSAGLRVGAFLAAQGILLGRAVAGDWHSATETVMDFARDGWAGAVLLMLAVPVERALRPSPAVARPALLTHGLAPGIAYLAGAVSWAAGLGWWEGAAR